MRQDHPELLTTLRDVAATAVTIIDTFAQIRRERTAQQPPAPSPTQHIDDDDPTDASAPQADLDDAPNPRPTAADPPDPPETAHAIFLTTLRREPEMTRMEAAHRRLVGPIRRMDPRESQQWAPARKLADSINDRLFEIAELAHNAIQEDGLRTLPILDALIERLHDEFRDRTGPFAAVPDIGLVR
jgi:hypothetical protein